MSPLILLIIIVAILLLFVVALLLNHLYRGRISNANNEIVVHVPKWKAPAIKEIQETVQEEPPKEKKIRQRIEVESKPPEPEEAPPVISTHKAEVRKKLRRNMMKSEIWNRIWS